MLSRGKNLVLLSLKQNENAQAGKVDTAIYKQYKITGNIVREKENQPDLTCYESDSEFKCQDESSNTKTKTQVLCPKVDTFESDDDFDLDDSVKDPDWQLPKCIEEESDSDSDREIDVYIPQKRSKYSKDTGISTKRKAVSFNMKYSEVTENIDTRITKGQTVQSDVIGNDVTGQTDQIQVTDIEGQIVQSDVIGNDVTGQTDQIQVTDIEVQIAQSDVIDNDVTGQTDQIQVTDIEVQIAQSDVIDNDVTGQTDQIQVTDIEGQIVQSDVIGNDVTGQTDQIQVTDTNEQTKQNDNVHSKRGNKRRKHGDTTETQQKHIQKKLRMRGEKYLGVKKDASGKTRYCSQRSERILCEIGCGNNCRKGIGGRKCISFDEETRLNIFNSFWKDMTWKEKKVYTLSLINKKELRNGNQMGRKKFSYQYFLKKGGERIQVCKKLFLSTLGLKEDMVYGWMSSENTNIENSIPKSPNLTTRITTKNWKPRNMQKIRDTD
ncbi:hypothetical protein KUTeg_005639 [Tegillarca granosa]|uniref:Uncharacterized protein n=1 Tax=Tegillarca granosa TaxID=220873 RepID=A0ABQ9FKC2_TEGGR|nr:hypothetical protein KUTeg_005639 [Tegillarca granosa]